MRSAALALALLAVAGCSGDVHPHLVIPDLHLGAPSFFPTLEAYTATPIVGGNRVDLLLNGEEIVPAMIEAVASAQRTTTGASSSSTGAWGSPAARA